MKQYAFGFAIVLALTSCSGGGGTADPIVTVLDGHWKAPCALSSKAGVYDIKEATFQGSSYTITVKSYQESTCTTLAVTTVNTGTITVGDAVAGVDGAKQIDQTSTSIQMTLHVDSEVSFGNAFGYGGYTDWKLNEPRELLNRPLLSGTTLTYPAKAYTIFKVSGSQLTFGDNTAPYDGSSQLLRPTTLKTDRIYQKQ